MTDTPRPTAGVREQLLLLLTVLVSLPPDPPARPPVPDPYPGESVRDYNARCRARGC